MPLNAKRSFWERKHREAIESERKRIEFESHLETLRRRKDESRWCEQKKRSNSFTCLLASDSTEGNLPTCDFVEKDRKKSVENEPKISVTGMKSHWNGRVSRKSHADYPDDSESSERTSGDQIVKSDVTDFKKRQKAWSKEHLHALEQALMQQSRSRNKFSNPYKNDPQRYNNDEMRRSQSYSALDIKTPSSEGEFRKKKPKMPHEKLTKGGNIVVSIPSSEREKLLNCQYAEKEQGEKRRTTHESDLNSVSTSSAEVTPRPKLYTKKNSTKQISSGNLRCSTSSEKKRPDEADDKQQSSFKSSRGKFEKNLIYISG